MGKTLKDRRVKEDVPGGELREDRRKTVRLKEYQKMNKYKLTASNIDYEGWGGD